MILRAMMIGLPVRGIELADVAEKIGKYARPGVDPSQVHIRTFLAANSQPSKDGILRIREKAIRKLAKLYPGAPLMRNHGMFGSDDMPIGTVFDASHRAAPDGQGEELLLSFLMAKGDPAGDQAAKNIDLGIWKESSVHGMFSTFECSICGKSLDPDASEACTEHEIGSEYEGQMARIELDDPTEAPEFSLCWSGRLAGTRALAQEIPGTISAQRFMAQRGSWLAGMKNGTTPRTMTWMEEIAAKLETQSIVCSKERFKSADEARAFLASRGMEPGTLAESGSAYYFARFPAFEAERGTFRTKEVTSGVSLVLCRRKGD